MKLSKANLDVLFEVSNASVPGARPQPMYRITCRKCGAQDVCPQCKNKERRRMSTITPALTVVPIQPIVGSPPAPKMPTPPIQTPPATSSGAEPPASPSREDRRVIFAKLQDVYIDERVGYSDGWSDQRVATDLGVARAWVKSIRDENFGPEASNDETRRIIAEANAILKSARDLRFDVAMIEADADALRVNIAGVENARVAIEARIADVDRSLGRIMKALGA